MLEEPKRQRFQYLRERESKQLLSEEECEELTLLIQEIEIAEAAYLNPATKRLRKDRENIESQNRALESLVRRKEILVNRLQTVLEESQAEREAIQEETVRVLGDGPGAGTPV
ncbi:MAG: hypothetical protein QF437_07115, partial [Planctomycetota bacterium]|jgi:hypothetical protein|nr:hypothetical protein [Planctomycetota bacterium]MDP7130240.1 hypothetical protein [Planctomycetota bacterium]MDP7249899.1 hypothetical protein [Planctomycetota bacterium]|tara:strand:+ start:88 stop:426 length:339 start_codon:yes stop_codon:yes gene_type:complete